MKKMTLLLFTFFTGYLSAQILTNNGADIALSNGSQLLINGSFENQDEGSLDNAGIIYLTDNWSNNATSGNLLQGSSGNVNFIGTGPQIIGGSSKTWFHNLSLQSETNLATHTSVSGQLYLDAFSLSLDNSNLTLENTASISGVSSSTYVVAEGSGRLIRQVGNSNVNFPVGTFSSFVPVILNNSGSVDYFGVKVFEDVLEGGTNGNTISEIDNCVNNTWDIEEQTGGGSDLSITPFWTSFNEGSLFDRSACGVGQYTGGIWNPQAVQNGSGTSPFSITRSGITEVSAFAVGDMFSPMVINLDLVIDLNVLLEGPFNGNSMKTDLNVQGLIPLAQPYNTSPWNYPGTEQVVSIPNANIIDWIFIQLRDASSSSSADEATIIAQQAGFILHDGSVVAIDGISDMQFNATVSQNLFVVVYHRNHIGIMSSNPLPQTDGNYAYNFTTDAYQAYGSTDPQKEIALGIFGMYGGDLNSNGSIESSDRTALEVVTGTAGYTTTDANFDGQTNNKDKNDITIQNIGEQSYIPE